MQVETRNCLIYIGVLTQARESCGSDPVAFQRLVVASKMAMRVTKMTIWPKIRSALNFCVDAKITIAKIQQICTVDWTTWSQHG
jgi:hypothetical protein